LKSKGPQAGLGLRKLATTTLLYHKEPARQIELATHDQECAYACHTTDLPAACCRLVELPTCWLSYRRACCAEFMFLFFARWQSESA